MEAAEGSASRKAPKCLSSGLRAILAHNLVELRIIDGRKDVRKPGLRAGQVSESAKHDTDLPQPPETA